MSMSNKESSAAMGTPSGSTERQDHYLQQMATDYMSNASSDPELGRNDSCASRYPSAEHQGEYEDPGTRGMVSHQEVTHSTSAIHSCSKTLCPSCQHCSTSRPVSYQAIVVPPLVKTSGGIGVAIKSTLRALGLGTKDESEEEFHWEKILTKNLRKEKEELTEKVADKDNQLAKYYRECSMQMEEKKRATAHANQLVGLLQEEYEKSHHAARNHNSQVEMLTAKISEYKSIADGLYKKLSSLEQSNSKVVGSTGAHKDSPAIPSNLEKSVFVVKEAAFACAKAFYILLKEQCHEAWPSHLARVDERFRKYLVQARICSRMFAGFENDSFCDSAHGGEDCLSTNHENTEFFLRNQDLDTRQQRYFYEYDELQKSGLQGVMEAVKMNKDVSSDLFLLFCSRKLVSTTTSLGLSFEECMVSENSESLLYSLTTSPRYCDQFVKPFVNLAMVTFVLHRLAFQFQPPARIFRYASGTRFDPIYMENAVFIDDDDSDKELYVGCMLVPGFQVGATIVKCTVYLVPGSTMSTGQSSLKLNRND